VPGVRYSTRALVVLASVRVLQLGQNYIFLSDQQSVSGRPS
jgi:hypothetical protein